MVKYNHPLLTYGTFAGFLVALPIVSSKFVSSNYSSEYELMAIPLLFAVCGYLVHSFYEDGDENNNENRKKIVSRRKR